MYTCICRLESIKYNLYMFIFIGQSVQIMKSQSSTIMNENGHHNEQHDLKEYSMH